MATRHRINPPLSLYKKITLTFIIVSIALVAVIFYFAISYAYITLYPTTEPISSDFTFSVVADVEKADPSRGIFPGSVIEQTVEGSGTFPVQSTVEVRQGTTGRVVIKNTYSKDQTLIATTRLLSPEGILYRLRSRVVVPAGGSVEAEVGADNPAAAKPVSAGMRFTIPGLFEPLQALIYAESVGEFTGESTSVQAVTQEDIDRALSELTEASVAKALADKASMSRVLSREVVDQKWSVKPGDQARTFTGTVTLRIGGVAFEEEPVRAYGQLALSRLIPPGKQLLSMDKTVVYEVVKRDPDNSIAQVKGTAQGIVSISEDNDILNKQKFVNLKPAVLKAYLENFDSIDRVDITFFPSWNRMIPRFEDHILIKIGK